MTIKNIRLTRTGNELRLQATCKIRKIGWDEVYFSFDGAKADTYICEDASPFAAALLIPAMRQGEDLIVKGSMSKQLYAGMQTIMDEVLGWDIGLKRIQVKADNLVADRHRPTRTASFFSGGVDSFYTYLKHKGDKVKGGRVDTLILVNGFDIHLSNHKLWQETLRNVKVVAAAESVELLSVATNIRLLVEPLMLGDYRWDCPWDFMHGGCLAGIGLSLRRSYRRIYIPSTFSVDEQLPWGSHLALDKHWSTESLTFVHDGTEATRVQKIMQRVALSPLALRHLRVCYENPRGAYNCGGCDKCLRTMTSLYAAGVLDQATTFPQQINTDRLAAGSVIRGKQQIFHGETQNIRALDERHVGSEVRKALESRIDQTRLRQNSVREKTRAFVLNAYHKLVYVDAAYFGGFTHSALSNLARKLA